MGDRADLISSIPTDDARPKPGGRRVLISRRPAEEAQGAIARPIVVGPPPK